MQIETSPITLLYVYADEDEALRIQLERHLSNLRRQNIITEWHDRKIIPGTDWKIAIDYHLQAASIILLLISSDFLASDYIFGAEMNEAIKRHHEGTARVIPIILRPVDLEGAPFAHLQCLPSDGKPITIWKSIDEAFANVVKGIRRVCEDIKALGMTQPELFTRNEHSHSTEHEIELVEHFYDLYEVFKKSGVPEVTFVKREDFELLKLALAQPGRGVVIEGPSGAGKTTSVEKAVADLQTNIRASRNGLSIQKLSARNPEDISKLQTLRQWHQGTVIIDDFHRLEQTLRRDLIDYLKYLADIEPLSKKLVIIGIPQTGQTLVNISFDIAMRIDVFQLGMVRDELILRMIGKGEKALNIKFERRGEIANAANGSLNIAQFLCFNICYREQVKETQNIFKTVKCDMEIARSSVMVDLSRKFSELIRRFVTISGPGDSIGLHLLEELARSKDGSLFLLELKGRKPGLATGIDRFVQEHWMDRLYKEYPASEHHLFFDQIELALVVDDPQLIFYLKEIYFPSLARAVGENPAIVQKKVFISYSHKDKRWLDRLRIHITSYVSNNVIDLWDDTKIAAGAQWREAITEAMETASAAILLVSADFLASNFIVEHELPILLSSAASRGMIIIPIIVSPCAFQDTELSKFQAINSPTRPLTSMKTTEREEVLDKVAKSIFNKFAD